jgi:AcrR family transcriptional regulator
MLGGAPHVTRPRISQAFLDQHRRDRLVTGLAHCIVDKGYRATTVTDVVAATRVARNTFYDCFGSKEAAGRHLLELVCPALDVEKQQGSVFVLTLEIAARLKLDDQIGASSLIADAELLLDRAVVVEPIEAEGTEDDPALAQLPPGRHGLPREFVTENQRRRLLAGTARAVYQSGYEKATIADITRHAAISRRTFYEHFGGKDEAVRALVEQAEHECGGPSASLNIASGLGSLWAEIVAAAFAGDEVGSTERRRGGQAVTGILAARLELKAAA